MSRVPPRLRTAVAALASLALLSGVAACSDAGEESSQELSSGDCSYQPAGSPAADADPPPADPTVEGEVPVALETSAGTVTAVLDADGAPCTVNSFVSLAEQGYFDQTPCVRLTTTDTLSVLQCGDPSGTGGGGPGYVFADELSGEETYPAGTLAMANRGPDTNGSQFFLVYQDSQLPPSYTVFGSIAEEGLSVLRGIAEAGVVGGGPDGPPATPVEITSVEVG